MPELMRVEWRFLYPDGTASHAYGDLAVLRRDWTDEGAILQSRVCTVTGWSEARDA